MLRLQRRAGDRYDHDLIVDGPTEAHAWEESKMEGGADLGEDIERGAGCVVIRFEPHDFGLGIHDESFAGQ